LITTGFLLISIGNSVDRCVEKEGITHYVGGELFPREFLRRYLPARGCKGFEFSASRTLCATLSFSRERIEGTQKIYKGSKGSKRSKGSKGSKDIT
jgi:hypothetical protein